jgi:dTDP-4-dehydrorhamnose reductase
MKILLTGAKGQLGRDCTRVLETEHTALHSFGSRELDITDNRQVTGMLHTINPDIVINCAAFTAVDACESNRELCRQVNEDGPGFLAAGCAQTGARLIHISTDYVYDGRKPAPEAYTEKDPVNPISEYGAGKLAGEELIRERTGNHLIIRTAWLYGIGSANFLKTMLRLAVRDPRKTIRVVHDQYGSLTWTYRLAGQIKTLLESGLTGTIHATAEGHCSWYEGAKYFLECMEVPHTMEPCTTAEYPTPAKRPANSILENRRLKKHGLNRMNPWQKDIELFAARYRDVLLAEAGGRT